MSTVTTGGAASTRKPLVQSASRDETFLTCSQLYAAKYIYRIPDPGNEGAHRGTVCHEVLELLLNPRHKRLADAAVEAETCRAVPALWKLILAHARKLGVDSDENLKLIDGFMLVALTHEFRGPPGTVKTFAEREFELDINEPDGRRYRIRGAIDQTFIVQGEEGLIADVRDFKSSKQKFAGEKASFNTQSIIYQLVAKRLHPDIARRRFRFLFLKMKRDPWQEFPPLTDDQLYGYEWILTDLQKAMESFTLASATDNLASQDEEKRWLCGREGVKKDGTPAWICPAQRPLDYYVITDDTGEIASLKGRAASAFTAAELEPHVDKAKGQRVEMRSYPGCPSFWRNGRRVGGLQ